MTRPALLVMDLQKAIVGRVPGLDAGFIPRLARAVAAARAAGVPVVHVVVGFRPGRPEAKSSPLFGALPEGAFTETDPGAEIHPDVAPRPGEAVVTKKRVSAFTGSDLDLVLRGAGVDHLVLTGLATSGVVLSTLRQAADLDYRLTVLADGCADRDPEVHRVLTEKVFPNQSEVTTVDGWIAGLG
ncbi:isochorismatase family cysteine hydrolase [Streptomyces sp. SID7909]|uniref:cysteine hydrolase family protein n=1 Tax=Streptomyces sp. SID7909 TaxID=2706092 RepID=UPI0013BE39C3|nr:isochorismatase family cysteine hydrolase [Streptomyces sp. SID7909]NEC06687.1 cysteine hydrolase [Streptomyces sp. SID7909]